MGFFIECCSVEGFGSDKFLLMEIQWYMVPSTPLFLNLYIRMDIYVAIIFLTFYIHKCDTFYIGTI